MGKDQELPPLTEEELKKLFKEYLKRRPMSDRVQRASIRFLRALIAVLIAGIGVEYGNNELYILLAPLLLAIDKFVRD